MTVSAMPVQALSPTHITKAIKRCLGNGLVPLIRSSPGMGKSEIIQGIARQANLKLIDYRLSQADITDLNGLPNFSASGRAAYIPFEDFPLQGDPLPPMLDENGVQLLDSMGNPRFYNGWLIFFDELTSAPKQMQAAAYKVLLEKKMGQRSLHDKVWMACAGNLESDQAVTHSMSTALQSRLIHLQLEVSKEDWIDWAIKNDVDERIIAFIEFKPSMLHDFQPNHSDRTYPCPRTWWFVNLLTKGDKLTLETDLALLTGTIGPGAAQEYIQFTRIFESMPSVDEIIANPSTITIPAEPSVRYAFAVMLASHFTDKNATDLMKFVARLPVEARLLCMRMVAAHTPDLIRHPALIKPMADLIRL